MSSNKLLILVIFAIGVACQLRMNILDDMSEKLESQCVSKVTNQWVCK